jgi:uncharacterized repeat protein (TIGR03917 family)
MGIVPSPDRPRHTAPRRLRPIAGARSIGDGFFEVAVQPGAYAADVSAALDAVPFDAVFVEVYDDIDTVLIFKPAPHAPPAAVTATSPAAPAAPGRPAKRADAHPELVAA